MSHGMHSFTSQYACVLLFSFLYLNTATLAQDELSDSDTDVFTGALPKDYSTKKLIRLTPRSSDDVTVIAEKLPAFTNDTIDFWTEPNSQLAPVDFMIDETFIPLIRRFTNYYNMSSAKIVLDDIQSAIDATQPLTVRSAEYRSDNDLEWFFRDFRRLAGIHEYIDQLATNYPHLITVDSIGKSFEKRDMRILRISSSSVRKSSRSMGWRRRSVPKEIVFIDAGIHAREWIAPTTALWFAYSLVSKYGKDETFTRVLDNFDFVILPSANPDGYEFSHTSDRMWRKTRSRGRAARCVGVDPNRNFDFHWNESGTSKNPCSATYPGSKPFSEPETLAMARYLSDNRDVIRVYISLHSYTQMWLYPWGYKTGKTASSSNAMLERKAKIAVNALRKVYGTNFEYGTSGKLLYPAAGGSDDWAFGKLGIPYSYTVELKPGRNAPNGFLISPDEIKPSGIETTAGIIALVNDIVTNGDATS